MFSVHKHVNQIKIVKKALKQERGVSFLQQMSPTWGAHCPSPPLPPHKRLSVPILYQNQNQTSPQKAGTALILTAHGGEGPLRGESASLWEAWQARALSGSARPQHRPPSSPPRGGEPIAQENLKPAALSPESFPLPVVKTVPMSWEK